MRTIHFNRAFAMKGPYRDLEYCIRGPSYDWPQNKTRPESCHTVSLMGETTVNNSCWLLHWLPLSHGILASRSGNGRYLHLSEHVENEQDYVPHAFDHTCLPR